MSPIKILLVDDDEDDFILTKALLKDNVNSDDYELSWCDNFSDGIIALLKGNYDVFLLDYWIGRESGIDLLNEAIKSNCPKPIIILTGKGDFRTDQEALRLGASDYLVKDNITGESLERSIRYAITQNSTLQQLKSSESKFRILFERSKDPMFIIRSDGKIIEANAAAVNYLEYSTTALLKTNAYDLFAKANQQDEYIKAMNEKGSITEFEAEVKTRTGKTKVCSVSSFLQVSQNANEELYYSIIHDLTSRVQQEKDFVVDKKLEINERISKKISGEIQNPLSHINLAVDELHNCLINEDHLVLLDIIKGNFEKINEVTSQLLESTQISLLNLSSVSLNAMLTQIVENLRTKINIDIEQENLLNPLIINADEKLLKTAFNEIIKNAAEATQPSFELINISVETDDAYIKIDITDNGEGIAPADLERIFEPFFTTKTNSIGLGLTRAQRIVHAHNGKFIISGEQGVKTIVSVFLPHTINNNF